MPEAGPYNIGLASVLSSRARSLKVAFVAVCVAIVYFRLASWWCWNVLAAVSAAAALWQGRLEERLIAAVMTIDVLLTIAVWPNYWVMNSEAILLIDTIETAAIIAVAIRSRLWWPSWCAAFHVMAVINHLFFLAPPHAVDRWVYVSGIYIWSWLGLIPLSLGTFDAWRERRVATPPRPRLRSTGVRLGG